MRRKTSRFSWTLAGIPIPGRCTPVFAEEYLGVITQMVESAGKSDLRDTGRSGGEQIPADFQPVFVQEIDRRLLQVLPEDKAAFAPAYICKC